MEKSKSLNLDKFGSSLRAIINTQGEVVEGNDKFKGYFPDNVYSIEELIKQRNTGFQWTDVVNNSADSTYSTQIADEEQGKKRILKINISHLTDSDLYVFEAVDLSEETEAIDALKHIITTNNAMINEDYFKILVLELAKLIPDLNFFAIGKLDEQNNLQTIATTEAGNLVENFNYGKTDTPIDRILEKGKCIYPSRALEQFPQDVFIKSNQVEGFIGVPINSPDEQIIGMVIGMGTEPIKKASYVSNVIDAFAVKAGVEFERIKLNSVIESVKKRLDQKVSKLEMQHCLMSELSSSVDIQNGEIWSFSKKLTKLVAQKLHISRVSVWMLNDELSKQQKSCIYELEKDKYVEGDKKLKDIFEKEFDNFIKLPYLDSNELADVSFLSPYVANYLKAHGVQSMLDCPIRSGDKVLGVLSFENMSDSTSWMTEEKYFIVQLANLLSLTITNLKNALAYRELEDSRNMLHQVQNIAKFGTFTIDLAKKTFEFSSALKSLLNTSIERYSGITQDLSKLPILEFIQKKDRQKIEKAIKRCTHQGTAFNEEFHAELNQGGCRLLRCEGIPVKVNGRINRVIGFVQDITDLVEARDEAEYKQKRIENFVEQSPLGIIEWGLNFEIKDWNAASERIFGWKKSEILGKRASSLIPNSLNTNIDDIWNELIEGRGGDYILNENVTKEGEVIYCEWRNTPLLDHQQTVVGVLSFVQNVTERIKSEDKIKKSENKFSTIFETSPDAISISEVETGKIIEVNPGYSKISGWKQSEIIGRTSIELNIWMNQQERESFIRAILDKREVDGMEMQFRRKDGETIIGMLSGRIVQLNDKPHLLAYFHDISDRKKSEIELKEINKRFELLTQELDERVTERTAELSRTVEQLTKREADFSLLSRMQDLVLSCQTRAEILDILKHTVTKLYPKSSGGLALYQDKEKLFTAVLKFGDGCQLKDEFSIDACWGLRQGRVHEMRSLDQDPCCNHFEGSDCVVSHYLCLPLMVQGRTFGLFWLDSNDSEQGFTATDRQVVISIADTIKLALSNLDLRTALHNQAVRDPLTGLYNRRHLQDTLEKQQARSERTFEPYSIALIDIDHFKKLNDTQGHDAGDAVLVALSSMLQTSMDGIGTAFRYGGEEFVILLPNTNAGDAIRIMDDIRKKWRHHRVAHNGKDLGKVTMSVGVSCAPEHGKSPALLISSADKALYYSKENGRDQVQLFSVRPTTRH